MMTMFGVQDQLIMTMFVWWAESADDDDVWCAGSADDDNVC